MLEEVATAGDESIVSWQPHGKAFRVHQPDAFARTVMPRYFKQQTKYKSFLRQLHLYGFDRIKKGMDRGAYFHSMFTRENKSISLRMSYQKIKGKKSSLDALDHRAARNPDFYSADTNGDKDLENVLQAEPILQAIPSNTKNKRASHKHAPATALPIVCADHRAEEDNQLCKSGHQSTQAIPLGVGLSPQHQPIDWIKQAPNEDEQASPSCDVSFKVRKQSISLQPCIISPLFNC